MDARAFFSELQNFLPVYVSPRQSYVRAMGAFVVVMLLSKVLEKRLAMKIDIDGDGLESKTEARMKLVIYYGSWFIFALMVANLTYTVSWRLSNRVNLKHLGYKRWFPSLYS